MKEAFLATLVPMLLLGTAVGATTSVTELVRVSVFYGENVSEFRIEKRGDGYFLEFASAGKPRQRTSLSRDDLAFLAGKLRQLPAVRGELKSCPRRWVLVTQKTGKGDAETSSCLGGHDPTSAQVTKLANLLAGRF